MPTYKAPVDDVMFLLSDVFHIDRYNNLPGFADATPDLFEAVLAEAAKFCEDVLTPLNRVGDKEGCRRHDDGSVTTPTGFKDAYRRLTEGGWMGASAPAEFGGQGLPMVLLQSVSEFLCSANMAFAMYPGLTHGAAAAITVHGTPEQKALYLPKLISGEWTGTMNLTEPQCGTDLGLVRTRAAPQTDGSYKITGTKIFISAGEHDLAENIVHLVLARIDGAPEGIKGISLFIVPKFLPTNDGAAGARNAVSCGSIEEKMGIHGNSTCVMNYRRRHRLARRRAEPRPQRHVRDDERSAARRRRAGTGAVRGRLPERRRLRQGTPRRPRPDRRQVQGQARRPDHRASGRAPHADDHARVQRSGTRAGAVDRASSSDVAHRSGDAKERQAADDHMGLMTPVIKGVLTDQGFANTVMAQQMFGGHGYIAEHGMEQFVRDARIAMIYEGANGIQALDLVGRKLPSDGGRALQAFFAEVSGLHQGPRQPTQSSRPTSSRSAQALGDLQQATMWFMQNALGNPENAGAGSTDYMHLFGLVALGYMWCLIVEAAKAKGRDGGNGAGERMAAKLVTGRFFAERMLPASTTHLARIKAGAPSTMALPAEAF